MSHARVALLNYLAEPDNMGVVRLRTTWREITCLPRWIELLQLAKDQRRRGNPSISSDRAAATHLRIDLEGGPVVIAHQRSKMKREPIYLDRLSLNLRGFGHFDLGDVEHRKDVKGKKP